MAYLTDTYDQLFKIVLIGESGVGKSSLILRYMDKEFVEVHMATIGVDFSIRTVSIDGKRVKLQLWDTAGQERFRGLCRQFYRAAHAIIFVYDVTEPGSFGQLPEWLESVKTFAPDRVKLFVVGNKIDLETERVVLPYEGSEFARAHGMTFFETSARGGSGVEQLFDDIASRLSREAWTGPVATPCREPRLRSGRPVPTCKEPCCQIM